MDNNFLLNTSNGSTPFGVSVGSSEGPSVAPLYPTSILPALICSRWQIFLGFTSKVNKVTLCKAPSDGKYITGVLHRMIFKRMSCIVHGDVHGAKQHIHATRVGHWYKRGCSWRELHQQELYKRNRIRQTWVKIVYIKYGSAIKEGEERLTILHLVFGKQQLARNSHSTFEAHLLLPYVKRMNAACFFSFSAWLNWADHSERFPAQGWRNTTVFLEQQNTLTRCTNESDQIINNFKNFERTIDKSGRAGWQTKPNSHPKARLIKARPNRASLYSHYSAGWSIQKAQLKYPVLTEHASSLFSLPTSAGL